MGLAGMWFGIALANGLLVVAISYLIYTAPWEALASAQKQTTDRKNLISDLLNEKPQSKKKENEEDEYERV